MADDVLVIRHEEGELCCLGAGLVDPKAAVLVVDALREDDFTTDHRAAMYRALRALVSRGEPVDRVTLATELRVQDPTVPATMVLDIEEVVPTAANVRSYIRLVRRATIRRQLRTQAVRLGEALKDPDADVAALLGDWNGTTDTLLAGDETAALGKKIVPVKLGDALVRWEQRLGQGPEPRVRTPYPVLTHYLDGGFGEGELIYLGAVASTGKTALALELARAAGQDGVGTLIVSMEMVETQLVRRVVAQASRVEARSVKRGLFNPDEAARYHAVRDSLVTLPVWLVDNASTLGDIQTLVRRWPFWPPLGFVVVDYLQLVTAPAHDRRQEVESVSKSLKLLAKEAKLPVLALSSLSRLPAEVKERRPDLGRLKESSNLEHDADIIAFLYRESDEAEETECILRKNRDGAKGTVYLRFRPEFVAFDAAPEA